MKQLGDRHQDTNWDGDYENLTPIPKMTIIHVTSEAKQLYRYQWELLKANGNLEKYYPNSPDEFKAD